jgi:4-hydroxyacetophenone monooxygenase
MHPWSDAIERANIPTLLMVLTQLTGDQRWLEEPYRPSRTRGLGDNDSGGLPEHFQTEVRIAAATAIAAWRTGAPIALPVPDHQLLVRMLSVSLGEQIPAEYGSMIEHELRQALANTGTEKSHKPSHGSAKTTTPTTPDFRVIIVGAGMSGICASVALAKAGIEHEILEKHHTIGGTWLENRYPGCGVDVPSHLYSYSFAPHDWKKYFALRDDIHGYFEKVTDDFGVRNRIRFNTEVERASYDEAAQEWVVDIVTADGIQETQRANVVISAVGAFNKPRRPNLPGADTFGGPSVHTAQWPAELDLRDKHVAIIGNGASSMQIVPAIAEQVKSLTIFARSPHWAAPFEKFGVVVPESVQLLLREMPLYYAWYRLRLSWAFNDKSHAALQKDPAWPHPERSLNAINEAHRQIMTRYIESELGDRIDLLDKVVPTYPPFGKRLLLDNGWYRTLRRDNVTLCTDAVAEVHADHVTTTAGNDVATDVIVWATGFDVVHFLAPIEIRGRSGTSIHEEWQGDNARAYLGTAVPGFPNFFCLYGPNTQFGHGGSLIAVVERQMHYVMSVLELMLNSKAGAVEVRRDVHERYYEKVDAAHENMVWTHQGMDTYYRNSKGRVTVNSPFRIVDVWKMTERADPDDFTIEPRKRATV